MVQLIPRSSAAGRIHPFTILRAQMLPAGKVFKDSIGLWQGKGTGIKTGDFTLFAYYAIMAL
jgi:hypothetical protein